MTAASSGGEGAPRPSANDEQGAAGSDAGFEMANTVIQELFAVGFDLAACAAMVQGPAADRLVKALNGLDAVIAHIRRGVFQFTVAQRLPGHPLGAGAPVGVEELVDQLGSLAGWVDELAQTVPAEGAAGLHCLDAVHALHRARSGLAADLDRTG